MKIPSTASPEVQQAFRELWAAVAQLGGSQNVDLRGRRLINAGPAIAPTDYATLADVVQRVKATTASTAASTTTDQALTDLLALLQDAGLVFAKPGTLATDVDNLSWRYSNNSLRYGADVAVRWHHRAEQRSPDTGVLELSGEDRDVSNLFTRLSLGRDDGSGVALVRSGTTLEVHVSGPGGAFADVHAAGLFTTGMTVNGNAGVNFGPGPITSITIEKGIVTAAS